MRTTTAKGDIGTPEKARPATAPTVPAFIPNHQHAHSLLGLDAAQAESFKRILDRLAERGYTIVRVVDGDGFANYVVTAANAARRKVPNLREVGAVLRRLGGAA